MLEDICTASTFSEGTHLVWVNSAMQNRKAVSAGVCLLVLYRTTHVLVDWWNLNMLDDQRNDLAGVGSGWWN